MLKQYHGMSQLFYSIYSVRPLGRVTLIPWTKVKEQVFIFFHLKKENPFLKTVVFILKNNEGG
jgi:hypothetical protein